MSENDEPIEVSPLKCGRCGLPLTRISESAVDEAGPRRVEFECDSGHRLVLNRVETYDADIDPVV